MPFTKPLPHWEAPGIEPPTSLRQNGWKAGIKPPDEYFNYLQNKAYEALKELQEYAVHKDEMDLSGVATKEDLKVVKEDLTTHLADNTKHITEAERTSWNGKASGSHTHSIAQVKELQFELDKKVSESLRNKPNGFVGLDDKGKIREHQLSESIAHDMRYLRIRHSYF